jgi:acetate kinase
VRVLVVNAGSSSLKLALLDDVDQTVAAHELTLGDAASDQLSERAPTSFEHRELRGALAGMQAIDAVGHRIVHGGARFRAAVRVDAGVVAELRALADLAPLQQPKSLAALDAVSALLPDVPAVACFDTAFHATLPPAARTYALPAGWREGLGIRRYGFHGLSHAWVARRAPELLDQPASALRIVSCHLGAGASLCAIAGGKSMDTTMGFTPLEGLVMATRAGNVDPGALLWLLERREQGVEPPLRSASEMAYALEHSSGLLGLAGSADMREVLAGAEAGDERGRLALDVYIHRLQGAIAQMAASLGGLDVLVFTGGVGERSAAVRARAVARLGFLGLAIDEQRNRLADRDGEPASNPGGEQPARTQGQRAAPRDADVGAREAQVTTLVIAAREDLEIANQVRVLLAHPTRGGPSA